MNERFKAFVDYLIANRIVYNYTDFSKKIGIDRAYLSQILSGKRAVSENVQEKVSGVFPALNRQWLACGKGEMLTEQVLESNFVTSADQGMDIMKIIDRLTRQIEVLVEQNSRLMEILIGMGYTPDDIRERMK